MDTGFTVIAGRPVERRKQHALRGFMRGVSSLFYFAAGLLVLVIVAVLS